MQFHLATHSLLVSLICFLQMPGIGQANRENQNFFDFQGKAYYFGLTFGYNNSNFQLLQSKKFILNDSFNVTEGLGGPGLNVSIIGNMKLGEYFDFRFLPGFSFVGRRILYIDAFDELEKVEQIESVLIQIPLHVRFKSDPFHDKRLFVLAGAKYTYDVASRDVRPEQAKRIIRISPHDFSLEIGAGCQFFLPFFIFSPEIKFSQGIGNILIYNNTLSKTIVLEKILSRTFTISLHFEG